MGQVRLIRKGVVPILGAPVRLLGADTVLPKDSNFVLGTGWTQLTNERFEFTVPPGANFQPLQFKGLNIGSQYRLTFETAATAGYGNCVFRPGELGLDVPIAADGPYDITFTANNVNGQSRILHIDITGVSRITFDSLKLVAL